VRFLRLRSTPRGCMAYRVSHPYEDLSGVMSMTKIYVGNLPFSATEEQVRQAFAAHGTVESVNVILDRDTGRPRGFAFVEMNRADASRAIQALNGQDMGGRPLRVNEAQERPQGGGQRRSGGGGGGGGWGR
jgi:RNA recognition motif-containing protein